MRIDRATREKMRREKITALKKTFSIFLSAATTFAVALFAVVQHADNDFTSASAINVAVAKPVQATPVGMDDLLNQAIFHGPNRMAKVDRKRAPSAIQIANSFERQRFALLERKKLQAVPHIDPIKVASVDPEKLPTATPAPKKKLSFAFQPMPQMAALDAIAALDADKPAEETTRDPNQPFPPQVPAKLAYARDNAPKTKVFTQTLTQASMKASKKQHWCMATAIYFEARGESYRGQVAVAQVVRNRVKHSAYPNTICGVVFQNQSWRNRCQFSFACDGIPDKVNEKAAWRQAEEIATKVITGDIYLPEVANATHYHANYVWPKWASRLKRMTKIGTHIFYRFKNG